MRTFNLKVYEKGQVVLPLPLRERLHLKKGAKVRAFEYDGVIYLLGPRSRESVRKAVGLLPKYPFLSRALLRTRQKEFA